MGCLKGGVVANVVVPTGEHVRSRAITGSGRSARRRVPESNGIVENLVGYAKRT
jgi:hypothetical protein